MKKTLILILLFSFILLNINITKSEIEPYIIDGNMVYVNDSNLYLSASPHTTSGGFVDLQLLSKVFTGDITVAFGFDSNLITPTSFQNKVIVENTILNNFTCNDNFSYTVNPNTALCWIEHPEIINETNTTQAWNEILFNGSFDSGNITTHTVFWNSIIQQTNYIDIDVEAETINFAHQGVDRWKVVKNLPIVQDNLYNTRVNFELNSGSGKYWICLMPSSYNDDIETANTNGHLYCLDPWYQTGDIETYNIETTTGNSWASTGTTGDCFGTVFLANVSTNEAIKLRDVSSSPTSSIPSTAKVKNSSNVVIATVSTSGTRTANFTNFDNLTFVNGENFSVQFCGFGVIKRILVRASFYEKYVTWWKTAYEDMFFVEDYYGAIHTITVERVDSGNITDTCIYGGSGDWNISIEDNCTLSINTTLASNKIIVSGDAGILKINATILANQIHRTPTDFDGDFKILTLIGKTFGVII